MATLVNIHFPMPAKLTALFVCGLPVLGIAGTAWGLGVSGSIVRAVGSGAAGAAWAAPLFSH